MDQKYMARQILQYNRTSFEKSFSALVNMQNNAERMFRFWLNQTKGFPEEGKNFLLEWIGYYIKLREEYKDSVDEGYRRMESILSDGHEL